MQDSTPNFRQTHKENQDRPPKGFWRSQGDTATGREMPRAKREKVVRYYSHVLSAVLSALDDGRQAQDDEDKPAKLPSRSYIEFVLAPLGFDVSDWTRMGDDEIVRFNTCHIRLTDDAGHNRALTRFKKQRERMHEWQGEPGNPILIEHRVFYDQDEKRNYSEYKVPLAELLRDILADAPVGTNHAHLKPIIKRHVRVYLQRFEGTAKPIRKERHPSPTSDAHRSATLARKALDSEARKSGRTSAINLLATSLKAQLGDDFEEIFWQTQKSANSQESQEDGANSVCDKCHQPIRQQPPINPTSYAEKESAENSDEIQGVL
jgi:hypothetical protein